MPGMDIVATEGGERDRAVGTLNTRGSLASGRERECDRDALLLEAQAARDDAQCITHSRGEFLATISHALRTPLSAILGWAQVLERGACDAQTVQHGLAAILRNARLQVQLIEDLLDMNRIESGQLRLDLQRVEVSGVIAAAVDSARPAATAKCIGLRTEFRPGSGLVLGDTARLLQVVGKLLGNAIKFTPAGGQVSVHVSPGDGRVRVAVADSGQGIEPELLPRVFDRFKQQDAFTTRRHGGLGIGLPLVRQLVLLHGGTVLASSPGAGLGATFTVCLPATRTMVNRQPAGPAEEQPAPARPLAGVSLLLVDDEPDVLAVTACLLRGAGAHVQLAAGAAEALQMLRQGLPDAIVSDIGMPCMDGYELLRQVRCLPDLEGGRIPAAAYSAYTRPEDARQALAAGYQRHWSKPLAPVALVLAVMELVHSR